MATDPNGHVKSNHESVNRDQKTVKADREQYFRDKIGNGKNVTLEQFEGMDMRQRVMLKEANADRYRELSDAADHERRGLGGIL